jgi:hypothetical protein
VSVREVDDGLGCLVRLLRFARFRYGEFGPRAGIRWFGDSRFIPLEEADLCVVNQCVTVFIDQASSVVWKCWTMADTPSRIFMFAPQQVSIKALCSDGFCPLEGSYAYGMTIWSDYSSVLIKTREVWHHRITNTMS